MSNISFSNHFEFFSKKGQKQRIAHIYIYIYIGIETECVKKKEERSVSRVSNESFGSVTLTDYYNIEKSQESISYEPESDLDISFNSESGSEYFPSEQEIREREREMSDDEKISNKKTKV